MSNCAFVSIADWMMTHGWVWPHQSGVVLLRRFEFVLVLLHHAGEAAGVGRGAREVVRLGDGWSSTAQCRTTKTQESTLPSEKCS